MADAPAPITSPPSRDFQPYDATADGTVSGWEKVVSGPASLDSGQVTEDFPDGPGPWKQC
jgi:hypothetical protein